MLIFNHIPTAFPWYDKQEKQARYKESCEAICNYKLISPKNALLPFEFKRADQVAIPTAWFVVNANNGTAIDISANLAKVRTVIYKGNRVFYYDGSALTGLNLAFGFYYSRLQFADGSTYSEVFHIPEDAFNVGATNKYLKLEWYSSCSIEPFYYEDRVSGVPHFKNTVYLDTFVVNSEPEITEETEEDGEGNKIPIFQSAVIPYRITDVVTDYLKLAIVLMQLHDIINITTPNGLENGQISSVTTNSVVEPGGCLSTIDILFQQDLAIVRRACC